MTKKTVLTITAVCSVFLFSTAQASISVSVDAASSGRIMSSNGPQHLGGGNISGVIALNDTGDALVGDNGGNSFNFSLIVGFNTTPEFRTAVANGAQVVFSGNALFGVDDGLGGLVVKSTGNVDWAPISASVNAIGNSTTGTVGDSNNFRRHAAFNLGDAANASWQNVYSVAGPLNFAGNPYAENTTFTVDMTSVFSGLALSGDLDRVMIGVSAWTPNLSAILSNDSVADRVAFAGSSFELTAVPEPSTYAAMIGLVALGIVAFRRRK